MTFLEISNYFYLKVREVKGKTANVKKRIIFKKFLTFHEIMRNSLFIKSSNKKRKSKIKNYK